MKILFLFLLALFLQLSANGVFAQTTSAQPSKSSKTSKNMYIDVHHLGAGKVTEKDVAAAHAKDLAVEKKYGVHFIKYWVDESNGDVYCLSTAPDTAAIVKTHGEAHGLLPDQIYPVTSGQAAKAESGKDFYLDIHQLGAGNVTAAAVAGAHKKDLAVQGKYGVNFINYWVDEKQGVVVCLSQAPDSSAVINTHREAHGLIPVSIEKVAQGK